MTEKIQKDYIFLYIWSVKILYYMVNQLRVVSNEILGTSRSLRRFITNYSRMQVSHFLICEALANESIRSKAVKIIIKTEK